MDIQEIIKSRYNELPIDIKDAIKDANLGEKFNIISSKYNLHLDQNGSLQTETLLVMLGIKPSSEYVDSIQKELEIPRDIAIKIVNDVNEQILGSIKESLRKMEEGMNSIDENTESKPDAQYTEKNSSDTISAFEKAGDLKIEKDTVISNSPQYREENLNRDEVLKGIEDQPVSMIDHLLTTPVVNKQKVEEIKVNNEKQYSTDPYREQI